MPARRKGVRARLGEGASDDGAQRRRREAPRGAASASGRPAASPRAQHAAVEREAGLEVGHAHGDVVDAPEAKPGHGGGARVRRVPGRAVHLRQGGASSHTGRHRAAGGGRTELPRTPEPGSAVAAAAVAPAGDAPAGDERAGTGARPPARPGAAAAGGPGRARRSIARPRRAPSALSTRPPGHGDAWARLASCAGRGVTAGDVFAAQMRNARRGDRGTCGARCSLLAAQTTPGV